MTYRIAPSILSANFAKLGEEVSIGAVVTQDVAANAVVSGNFAVPHDRFLDHIRSIR